jgi:hypothetical protein
MESAATWLFGEINLGVLPFLLRIHSTAGLGYRLAQIV